MTIEQTVEVPASRRVILELPPELPAGKARISVTPITMPLKSSGALLSLRGSCKGLDTMEAYFERKRSDKEREDRAYRKNREST